MTHPKSLKQQLAQELGSQELAQAALNIIKPYWLERIGNLQHRYKPLTNAEILELCQYHKPDNLLDFARTLQNKIFKTSP